MSKDIGSCYIWDNKIHIYNARRKVFENLYVIEKKEFTTQNDEISSGGKYLAM